MSNQISSSIILLSCALEPCLRFSQTWAVYRLIAGNREEERKNNGRVRFAELG